jgi:predicted MPP superfamily phosphohydrolase
VKNVRVVLALGLLVGVLFAVHYYVWLRLVGDPGWPDPWHTIATVAIGVLLFGMPASFFLSRVLPRGIERVVLWPIYLWMGVIFLLLVTLGALELVRLMLDFSWTLVGEARGQYFDVSEANTVSDRTIAWIAIAVVGVLTLGAIVSAMRPIAVRDVNVPIEGLPSSVAGTSIVQLSDVHIGPLLGRAFLTRVVEETNALRPDLIAITGDLVDGSVAHLADDVAPLAALRAKHGTFFVTGNHEYYADFDAVRGADDWIAELRRLGIRVLRNETVQVDGLDVAGIDDHSAKRFMARGHGPDLARAVAGRDRSRPLLLLAHQPLAIHAAAEHGVTLQLSGHTHDGQIWPFKYLVKLQQPYVAGLARHGLRGPWIYVSRGTGFWGPPMRLFAPAEITRIVLRRA